MPNSYFNFTDTFTPGQRARSGDLDREYQAIESAFDLLPTTPASLTSNSTTYAGTSAGAANLYTVTMPNTRVANTAGDEVVFIADKTNSAAATIDVDSIGAVALLDWDGTALTGGEIVIGRLYEVRYNATDVAFRISANSDAAVKVGYAQEWAAQIEDTLVSVAAGGDGATDYSALHWAAKAATSAGSIGAENLYFAGTHDASTGAPATPAAAAVYHITVAGNFDSIDWIVGDEAFWDGANWQRMGPTTGTYFRFTATDRVVGSNAGTTQTGDSVFLANSAAGDVNLADEVIAIGPSAAALMADADFAGSIVMGARAYSTAAGAAAASPSVVIGRDAFAGNSNASSGYNVVVGPRAATFSPTASVTAAFGNVVVGAEAGERAADNTFSNSVLIGYRAGRCSLTNGFVNPNGAVYIGAFAGQNQNNGTNNTAVGRDAMSIGVITGGSNSAFGQNALANLSSGGDNVAIGQDAGTGISTESFNVVIGADTSIALASSVVIGRGAEGAANQADQIIIGTAAGKTLGAVPGHFVVESSISSGVNKKSFLFGNTADGNLALGRANSGPGLPINRDFGTSGENVFKIHDTPVAPTTAATAGATMFSTAGALSVVGGQRIYDDTVADYIEMTHNGTLGQIATGGTGGGSLTFLVEGETAINANLNGAVELYYNNILRFTAAIGGVGVVSSDGNTDTEVRALVLAHQDGTTRGFFGYAGTADFLIQNQIHGANVVVSGENVSGTPINFLTGDPDALTTVRAGTNLHLEVAGGVSAETAIRATANAGVDLYYNNGIRFLTAASGAAAIRSDGDTDAETRLLNFTHQDATVRALVGFNAANDVLALRNQIHGGNVVISAEDAGTAERTILIGDPDALTTLRGDTDLVLQTSAGESALYATADAGVALYFNAVQAFGTVDETAADQISGATVRNANSVLKPVGLGVVENDGTTFDTVATHTPFQQINAGETIYFVGAGAGTANYDTYANTGSSQTNIPNGTMWFVQNNAATTLLVIRGGTSVTIRYWAGTGAPADADVTVARGGVATIRKVSDSIYDVWGIGLS